MNGYSIQEFFEMYGITERDFLESLSKTAEQSDIKITASELCRKTGDGSITQERINTIYKMVEQLEKENKIRIMVVFHGKCNGFPDITDYLFIADRVPHTFEARGVKKV